MLKEQTSSILALGSHGLFVSHLFTICRSSKEKKSIQQNCCSYSLETEETKSSHETDRQFTTNVEKVLYGK